MLHKSITVALWFFCFTAFGQNITNMYRGQPVYKGMAITTMPSSASLSAPTFLSFYTNQFTSSSSSVTVSSVAATGSHIHVVVGCIYYFSGTASGATFNGNAMNLITNGINVGGDGKTALYDIAVASPVTANAVVSFSPNAGEGVAIAAVFNNVGGTLAAGDFQAVVAATITNNIAGTLATDLMISFGANETLSRKLTPNSPATLIGESFETGGLWAALAYTPGLASTTPLTWTTLDSLNAGNSAAALVLHGN